MEEEDEVKEKHSEITVEDGRAFIPKHVDVDIDVLKEGLVDQVTLQLLRPLKIGGEERTELTMDEPTGKHVEQMSKAGTAKAAAEVSFRILGECLGLSPDEVKQMRSRDLSRVGQVLAYFLPDSRSGLI